MKVNVKNKIIMRSLGFCDMGKFYLYTHNVGKTLDDMLDLNIIIYKDNTFDIYVNDGEVGNIYDYSQMLKKNPKAKYPLIVKKNVDAIMKYMVGSGVISDFKVGDSIYG